MDIFIYTYKTDAALLTVSVPQAAAHGNVFVVDDANEPATDQDGAMTLGAHAYLRTTWARGGNLNGSTAIRGMLETYRENGTDEWVMQCDSDTLLFRPDLLLSAAPKNATMIGQRRGLDDNVNLGPYVTSCGTSMLLRRDTIPAMLSLLDRPDIVARIDAGPGYSDHVITVLHQMSGGRCHLRRQSQAPMMDGVWCRTAAHIIGRDHNPLTDNAAVIFVYNKIVNYDTPAARTAATLAAMQQIAAEWCPETTFSIATT